MRYYHILRHEISIRGVSVHQDHFDPIRYSKTQTTKKKVKKFMGTPTYFRTFVKNFTELAEPITKLLRFPNFIKNFMLQTDASNIVIGVVLLQQLDGHITPIYCVSYMQTTCKLKYILPQIAKRWQ